MMLISQRMAEELEQLGGLCFIGNRIADRCQSQLKVKFVMPRTADIVHLEFAHKMPLIADVIADYCDDRNYDVNYPETPKDYSNYNSTKEIFDKLLAYMIDLETQTSLIIDIADEEHDYVTRKFLNDFLMDLVPYTKMMLSFVDYIEQNGYTPKDNMDMDARINKFMGIEPVESVDD